MAILTFKKSPYEFLSNMTQGMVIHYDGLTFDCTEKAYQYAKCETDADKAKILAIASPLKVKTASRTIHKRPDWYDVQLGIMRDLLEQKFHQEPFMSQLIATGSEYICEGNWWHDNFYGNCTCGKEKCKDEGLNHLGIMIMEIRDELIRERG